MLVLLLDAVGTVVDLPDPLLFVSLPCFPFMLEQIDRRLKSSDLKLIMLKFRFTAFFDVDDMDWACGDVASHIFGEANSTFSSSTTPLPLPPPSTLAVCCAPPSASQVLLVISKRSEFLLILFELSKCWANELLSHLVVEFECFLLLTIEEEQVLGEELLVGAIGLKVLFELPPVKCITSGLFDTVVFDNLLSMSKISFCHCISQKATLDASFESSHKLIVSSPFGVFVPQVRSPVGPADCHRSANVDIAGGRIGLLSNIRSSSSITLDESRGNNCKLNKITRLKIILQSKRVECTSFYL